LSNNLSYLTEQKQLSKNSSSSSSSSSGNKEMQLKQENNSHPFFKETKIVKNEINLSFALIKKILNN